VRQDGSGSGLLLPLWFSVYAVGAYARWRIGVVAVAAGWVAATAVRLALATRMGGTCSTPLIAATALDFGFLFVACFGVGQGFRFQRERARDTAERARLAQDNVRAVNAEAVARERNRLARDLHDLAAHEVMDALLSIRAMKITSDDPILPELEGKIARALDNMRVVVRALREDRAADPDIGPLGEAAHRLVDTLATERGIDVTAHIADVGRVSDAASSTTLAVLKEAVLNADTHAPGQPVTVALDVDEASVRLTVTNPTHIASGRPPRPAGTDLGLVGAGERADLVGGCFTAAPAPNGDWVLALQVPSTPSGDTRPNSQGAS
jgi:signal transduction histidine kinase